MERDSYWQRYWARRIGRRRFLRYAAGAAGTLAFLAACRQEAAPPRPAAPTAPQPPAPGQGGTIVFRDVGDPASFDYYKTWAYRTIQHMALVYPRLLKFKVGPDVGPLDYDIVPDLAVAMPEQPDATTYIFKLRPARWENRPPLNGRALTAEDVVKNWDRFKAEHPNRALLVDVERVEATAPDTVRFVLARPLGPFINHIGHHGMFYIMPYELFGTGQLEKDMWSAGPFIFRGYDVGSESRFEFNPNYFLQGRPYASRVVIRYIPDHQTMLSLYRTRQLDASLVVYSGLPSARDVADLKRDLPGATFLPVPFHVDFMLHMDLRDPVFRDKRVRQAISMAINRDDLARISGEGFWVLEYGALTRWYFDPKKNEFPNARYYQHNPQEARALLRAAGVERAGPYDLIAARLFFAEQMDYAQYVQEQLRAVGIETRIKELPFAEFYAQVVVGPRWPSGLAMGAHLGVGDPNETYSILWSPGSPRIHSPGLEDLLRQDAELLDAIERQRRELDPNRRREAVRQVVNIVADRMYGIPVTVPIVYHVRQEDVVMPWISSYGMEYAIEAWKRGP
jgi:peptide/nickel transport system substrate-binding protein